MSEERIFKNPYDITTVDDEYGPVYKVKQDSGIGFVTYDRFPASNYEMVVTFTRKPVEDAEEPA